MAAVRRFLLRFVSLFRPGRAEADLAREIEAHLQLLADEFLAQGVSAGEARCAARRAFGGVEQAKERQRDVRSFRWLDESWLDLKLGARMMIKHPGLTLVGGLGIAVAIAIGALSFAVAYTYLYPTLPLDEGERVVGIVSWDAEANDREPRSLHDFAAWRDELRSIADLGAFRALQRNLIIADRPAEPVPVAEITASGFRLARVAPLLGRALVEQDEREGAPAVIVIAHDVWRSHFASDPAIVGRTVRLGATVHTVVGVMPEGFEFPVNHRFWVPLQADPSDYERRQGPEIHVFGRLAPGVTLAGAQAELTAIGLRTAAAFPQTHERLRPRIVPYTALWFDEVGLWEVNLMQLLVTMLLVVVCTNVAILVYARTVTRQGEIAVRTALGASRRRIVAQHFLEALVLATASAAVGLLLADRALAELDAAFEQRGGTPFWIAYRLSSGTVFYALWLAVLGALIMGVAPALKATGSRLQPGLRELGGGMGLQLGKTWTALTVAQVAVAVAFLPAAISMGSKSIRSGMLGPGYAAEEFLTAHLTMDREAPRSAEAEAYRRELASRYGERLAELVKRLEAQPGVSRVTFASQIPGEEATAWIEVDGVPRPLAPPSDYSVGSGSASGHEVRFGRVGVGFFDTFDVPLLAGRRFHPADLGAAATAVIVNRTLVRQIFGDADPVGRRIRYAGTSGDAEPGDVELERWYEIVGVVADFPANPIEPGMAEGKLYHPAAPGQVLPATLALRLRGATAGKIAGRLREITTGLDPSLRLNDVLPMDEVYRQEQMGMHLTAVAVGLVTLSVLLLSAAGIYALMSFTIVRRRHEIGIRVALGAGPRRILGSILSRALWQLATGVVVGVALAALVEAMTQGELMDGKGVVLLPTVSALMTAVGVLAAVRPACKGLQIQPMRALRED